MRRLLKIAVTALCLAACLALLALRVRSFWVVDDLFGPISDSYILEFQSVRGRLGCHTTWDSSILSSIRSWWRQTIDVQIAPDSVVNQSHWRLWQSRDGF